MLPVTLLIVMVAFGALAAASIPVVLAFTAGWPLRSGRPVQPPAANHHHHHHHLADRYGRRHRLLAGFLRRKREEGAAGHDRATALRIAAATSGPAVLISGTTVIVAMAGMLLAGAGVFPSIAVGP